VPTPPPLITFLTPALDGGIGRNTLNLANELRHRGFAVEVIVETRVPGYDEQLEAGIALRVIPTTHPLMGLPWMLAYLWRHRPAAVATSNVRLAILCLRARGLAGVPVRLVATVHNTYSLAYRRLEPGKLQRRIAKYARYYPRLDAIIAVSEGVREDFAELAFIAPKRITRIYNPIVTADLAARAAEDPDHPWLNERRAPVIVTVGRLYVAKNFPLLIDAFERLRAERRARLIIVGDGPLCGELEDRIAHSPFAEDIDLAGFRANPYAFMTRADLFAMSSNWEGFGNVLAEALACGAPAVATDCPHGPAEILDGGRYGRLVPVGDEAALARAMAEVLDDPPEAEHQRRGAQRFTVAESAEGYLEALGLPRRVSSQTDA
jgi:glycosyltransferase involved in cell wall biosynthesis